jgi:hypothetical protein
MTGYDFIGDIHGEARKLRGLLNLLGYAEKGGAFVHDERQAVFVGDLIDRGGDQSDVLVTVRAMVERGSAHLLLGNHEFNAIGFATPDPRRPRDGLREHSDKNVKQHKAFLQLPAEERAEWIEWFKTLPLWLELDGGVRAVHACWHDKSIDVVERALEKHLGDRETFFIEAATEGTDLYEAVEILLKGPEMDLDDHGLPPFTDQGGVLRSMARIRWWRRDASSPQELAETRGAEQPVGVGSDPIQNDQDCTDDLLRYQYQGTQPVLFGHYWREWPAKPQLDWTSVATCVDFSAAGGGPLVAYCWSGETALDPSNYVAYLAETEES